MNSTNKVRFKRVHEFLLMARWIITMGPIVHESKAISYNHRTAIEHGWDPDGPDEQEFDIDWKWIPYSVKQEISEVG